MHDLLRFIFVGSVYLGSAVALVALAIWLLSLGNRPPARHAPSFAAFILGRLFPRSFPRNAPASGRGKRHRANAFKTMRDAKEYLASRIIEEAKGEGAPLTEVERKMLYFTESGGISSDTMAVNAEFERNYDEDEYERKIGELAGKIQARDAAGSEHEQAIWDDAVEKLSEGDHYLLVLLDAAPAGSSSRWPRLRAFLPVAERPGRMPPGDIARLIVSALVFSLACFLLPFRLNWVFGSDWSYRLHHFLR